jgi:hypothetical protein
MAYALIGGTAFGTVLILLFLPALYAAWFRIKPTADDVRARSSSDERTELRTAMAAESVSNAGGGDSTFSQALARARRIPQL